LQAGDLAVPEVAELWGAVVKEDVGGFDVAVDYAVVRADDIPLHDFAEQE
jgi:hypothetical protein